MASHTNYSQQNRKIKSGYFDDPTLSGSNNIRKMEDIDYEE
jgi:hypothetical protein